MTPIPTSNEAGIIIACYPGDLIWAKGCIGSLRMHGNRLPIMLLYDGEAQKSPVLHRLLKLGLVQYILDRNSVRNPWLRDRSFGWGFTKMVAFYESPWERFLYLDADTAVSGDVTNLLSDLGNDDMLLDKSEATFDAAGVDVWFFDTKRIGNHFPDFDWRRYCANYFCTGVFAARRNAIPLCEYQAAMATHLKDPHLHAFGGEMGMLNILIFHAHQRGLLHFTQRRIQMLTADHDNHYLHERLTDTQPWVFHYAGRKPLRFGDAFNEPMTSGRKLVAKSLGCSLAWEDTLFRQRYLWFRVRKRVRHLLGRRV